MIKVIFLAYISHFKNKIQLICQQELALEIADKSRTIITFLNLFNNS